jgi:hypothetical protein
MNYVMYLNFFLNALKLKCMYSGRIYRPSFRKNKPKTLVFCHRKRAFWAGFPENWVYKFGHCREALHCTGMTEMEALKGMHDFCTQPHVITQITIVKSGIALVNACRPSVPVNFILPKQSEWRRNNQLTDVGRRGPVTVNVDICHTGCRLYSVQCSRHSLIMSLHKPVHLLKW